MRTNKHPTSFLHVHLALGAILVMISSSASAGHLTRARYDFSFDSLNARTTSWRVFLTNAYSLWGEFPSDLNVLTNVAEFPDTNPNLDDFGSRVRGYFVIPMAGDYSLTIGSDDNSGLWVSGDHTVPADFPSQTQTAYREPDAEETGWTNGDLFSPNTARLEERTTGTNTYTKGQVIYFEMFSQEGGGGDFIRLGWTRPDGVEELIPADFLIPFESPPVALAFANGELLSPGFRPRPMGNPADTSIPELGDVTFWVDVFGGEPPYTFQWKEDGTDIPGATLPAISFKDVPLSQSGRRYSCVVRDATAATLTSRAALLTVQADVLGPRLLSARGSGNPHGIVVTFDETLDPVSAGQATNYALSSQTVTVNAATMLAANQVLLTVSEFTTAPMTLTVNNVKDVSAAGNPVLPNSTAPINPITDLEGYWPFDEGSGSSAADLISGNHGTLLNNPTWLTTGIPSFGPRPNTAAVLYDGVNQYTRTPYPGIGGNATRTVSAWIKLTPGPGETIIDNGFVGWGNSSGNGLKYHFRVHTATGSLRTECQGGNNWATRDLRDGQWHHVISQLPDFPGASNDDVKHYVDGVLDPQLGGADVAIDTDITSASAVPVLIGNRDQTGNLRPFPGAVDDVAIFASELTDAQIAQLAAGTNPLALATPLAGPLTFTQTPQNRTVSQNRNATFAALATGSAARIIGYQWYRDNVALAGETGTSLTLPTVGLSDSGAQFRVEAYNQDGTFARIISATVTLTVVDDPDPPALVHLRAFSAPINRIDLVFNELLDQASAETVTNYTVAGVTINSALLLADGRTVSLFTSALTDGATYTVQVKNVEDLAGNAADLSQSAVATITYRELVFNDGPVAYWPMDDLIGPQVANLVNPNWPGTLNSGITGGALPILNTFGLVPNAPGPAIGFVAAQGNRIQIPDNVELNAKSPNNGYQFKTVELWFRANSLPTLPTPGSPERMFLFEQGGTTRGQSIYLSGTQVANPTTAEIHFHSWNDSSDAGGVASPWGGPESEAKTPVLVIGTVELGKTYHAVMVMDGVTSGFTGELRGYLNGALVGTAPGVGLLYNAGDDAGIGAINQNSVVKETNRGVGYGDPFDGVIDEFAYYNQALTTQQIAAHYAQGLVPGPVPTIESVFPAPGSVNVAPQYGIQIVLKDQTTGVNTNSVTMLVNGLAVTPTVTSVGGLHAVSFVAASYPNQAPITVQAAWENTQGAPGSYTWSFTAIAVLPEAWAAPVGSGVDRGFRVRSSQATNTPTLANTVARAEGQLATPPTPTPVFTGSTNLDIVNLSHYLDFTDNGYFVVSTEYPFSDQGFAEVGLTDPSWTDPNTNNFALELITYLELQPGVAQLGINSDDGFRLTAGRVPEETSLIVAQHDGGRGITAATPQSPALFNVTKAGVYAFRLVYFQGSGGAGLEWHVKDGIGKTYLLNGTGSPINAYRSRTQDPVRITTPATLVVGTDGVNLILGFATVDGATYEVQAANDVGAPTWALVRTIIGDGNVATVIEPLGAGPGVYRVETK